MTDPLADVVSLLQPGARLSKVVLGCGTWSVRRPQTGQAFYCVVMDGSSRLQVDGHDPLGLKMGDFVLVPAGPGFTMSSLDAVPAPVDAGSRVTFSAGTVVHGDPDASPNARLLVGQFVFGSPDAELLVSLLPEVLYVQGDARLSTIVDLVTQEARDMRPAREVVLAKLLEVMLIEALRSSSGTSPTPGLLRGLADPRLAHAIRRMHEDPARGWSIAHLAREAALSRTVFFERFNRALGMTPMDYLLSWRMALAKNMLRGGMCDLAEVAERVGYGSASSFSVAFTRFVGVAPSRFARMEAGREFADDILEDTPSPVPA